MGKKKKIASHAIHGVVEPKAQLVKNLLCSQTFLYTAVRILALVIFYYFFSIGLTFYNQRFIHHFKFPLSLTICHLVVKFILVGFCRSLIEWKTKMPRVMLSWGTNLKRIAPTGFASAFDIGLSNWSFEFITVSLYTMSKSTAVIFILLFALILKIEKWRWSLIIVVIFIAAGLFMFTYHSTQFDLTGFLMVMSASLLSGLRWTLAQMVTQKNELGLHNPIDMMYHIQPWMIIGLLPLSAIFEGLDLATSGHFFAFSELHVLMENLGLVLIGAFLAFMLEFSEFLLVSQTSSLTLSISGIFKELCTLLLAVFINGDKMSLVNSAGLVVCLFGIAVHVILKAVHGEESANGNIHNPEEKIEMLTKDGSPNIESSEEEEDVFNVLRDR
ncbi:hypothetical protein CHS0354_008701 [Potamilus streckersoni]|uniref:Sugar phosphate transporter domain-containing protein n=1 Tax=Potamilus streckersoni TaxID=2493646 RepID=A0AAE0WD83_9BIVA|nr:hypothetical protein CHS0354_008701 [Potamilus streckersoni]